jgi:hypothetical protein
LTAADGWRCGVKRLRMRSSGNYLCMHHRSAPNNMLLVRDGLRLWLRSAARGTA